MVAKPCFLPPGESELTPGSLRAKWRARVGMFVDLLGPELARKFVDDVVWRDEAPKVTFADPSVKELVTDGGIAVPAWNGERLGTLELKGGADAFYQLDVFADENEVVLGWSHRRPV